MQKFAGERKQKKFTVQRGLHLLTYVSAADQASAPTVSVVPDGSVEFLLHPDQTEPTLFRPGSAMVFRSMGTATVTLEISSSNPYGSLEAKFTCAPITFEANGQFGRTSEVQGTVQQSRNGELQILGHVANLGNVVVGADEWLGGPKHPARIEGVAISWKNKPDNLSLRYAVVPQGWQSRPPNYVSIGEFAGTKGEARPLTCVLLELGGPRSDQFSITAEAIFLGAPPQKATGDKIVLRGPMGQETLVGLRIAVQQIAVNKARAFEQPSSAIPAASPNAGRVRVFRG
jgi:hypothetical protein